MACAGTCWETEVRVKPGSFNVVSAVPNPNTDPCKSGTNKTFAINTAETQVENDEKARGEKVDNCALEPQPCTCNLPA
jgi:hypothetical protein